MITRLKKQVFYLLLLVAFSCGEAVKKDDEILKTAPWKQIVSKGTGTTVNFMMWQGSPTVNGYMNNYVVPTVKEKFNINLNVSGGQGPEIVQLVMGEKEAGIANGQVDIVWINGETFFQLRRVKGLWGPFVKQLPNAQYVDFKNPYIGTDFQQSIEDMEAPWSITQFALVYDTAQVASPPKNLTDLAIYVKQNPGTFTISNDFTGMTLLKSFLAELGGNATSLDGPFDADKYELLSKKLWAFINTNKKYFWKEGSTFPKEHSKMDQLFANGELKLSYGFSEGSIEDKVKSGLFPKTTRGYAWENGSVKNSNYLGILDNAPEKAGAMTVINFLMSPEAQLKKADVNGMNANTILNIALLTKDFQEKFENAPKRMYGPSMDDLEKYTMAEPAPEYMIKIYEDFRKYVIEK